MWNSIRKTVTDRIHGLGSSHNIISFVTIPLEYVDK